MAKFGMVDFEKRERLILDGGYDGGIDAYYIDESAKKIYIIQSKFRNTESNFEGKVISFEELLSMQIKRVTDGYETDPEGHKYNGKVFQFQRDLSELKNRGSYEDCVVLLANTKCSQDELKRLTEGYDVDVFDFERAYTELLYPVVSGNYYSQEDLEISINLSNTEHPRIKYRVQLGEDNANITVLFVPTYEIARVLYKYKNSILKYNPRSYLEMRGGSVNKEIMKTLTESDNNEFALFNNGITVVSGDCSFSEATGRVNKASLVLSRPQIINGGQTAFTLSKAYEESVEDSVMRSRYFSGKEVLVKIISFSGAEPDEFFDGDSGDIGEDSGFTDSQLSIIEKVSGATNRQSPIDEADRKANDKVQIGFQAYIFDAYGYYYERKRGEFGDGIAKEYICRDSIIKREFMIRCALAATGRVGEARRANKKYLYRDDVSDVLLGNVDYYDRYFQSYLLFEYLKVVEKSKRTLEDRYSELEFGSAFRYGKYAVIGAAMFCIDEKKLAISKAKIIVDKVLARWKDFEAYVRGLPSNASFFSTDTNMLNYYNSIASRS